MDNTFQKKYVEEAYDKIAVYFDKTRNYMWKKTEEFLNSLSIESHIIDVGCGNGKNILYLKNKNYTNIFGCDISSSQVDICKNKNLNVIKADNLNLPYEDNSFDCVLSVAVIHHFDSVSDRKKAIEELIRICKSGGKIFIQVWADTAIGSSIDDKIVLDKNDVLIPWRTKDGTLQAERYYHLFENGELETYIDKNKVDILESYEERFNYGVIIMKK